MRTCTLLLLLVSASAALAQPPAGAPASPPPEPAQREFTPPEPRSGGDDWIQFNNGEWLKGEIKDLQDGSLVFESDELDELTLDLDDIHAVYSSRTNTIMLRDRTLVEGALRIEGDEITAISEEGERVFSRDEVRSIIPGRPTELNYWSGRIGVGASARRGNVDQTDLTALFRLQRRTPGTRLSFSYDGAYSLLEGEKTANNHKADASFDVYLTDRLFLRPVQVSYFRDDFQNIEYRITPSAGFGYEIVNTSRLTWAVGSGLGWQFERFFDAPPGEPIQNDSSSILGFTALEWEATSKVDFGFSFDITAPFDDINSWNARTTAYSEIDLWGDLDLDIRIIWDRNNSPSRNADGTLPEKDDLRLSVGVSFEF